MMISLQQRLATVRQRIAALPPLEPTRYSPYFRGVTAIAAAAFVWYVLRLLPYYPLGWQALLMILVLVIWFVRPVTGERVALTAFILPVAYSFPYGGLGLAIAVGTFWIAWLLPPSGFLWIALAVLIYAFPPLLPFIFVVPLALAFEGPSQGGFLAGLTAFFLEILMLIGGRTHSTILSGGKLLAPLIHVQAKPIDSLIDWKWLQILGDPNLRVLGFLGRIFIPFVEDPLLLGQIILWSGSTALVAIILRKPFTTRLPRNVQALVSGMLCLSIGQVTLASLLAESGADIGTIASTALISGVIVLIFAPILEVGTVALHSQGHFTSATALNASEQHAPTSTKRTESKETIAAREIPNDQWSDLAGIDDIKDELQDAIHSQFDERTRQIQKRMGIPPIRGILLYGPPGTGKTKIARVIAHEANATFYAVSGTEFTSKWFGESEANLRRIFEEARAHRPAVLFFDELEAFLPLRKDMARSDAPEKGIISTFLAYTDGVSDMEGVLLVAATNYPNLIDPAALRPGRFDKVIYMSPPDATHRIAILTRYLAHRPLAEDVDLVKLSARMERFTGADIERVCIEASRRAYERTKEGKSETLTMEDLEIALGGTRPSVTIPMLREYEALADQYGRRSSRPGHIDVIDRPDYHWYDVAGLDEVKRVLREAIELPLAHPELFAQYRVRPHKGVLLFGPPGCGKTFLAKVVASEAHASFLHVRGPELLERFVGASEGQLRNLFIRARENVPCVLFFDELDAIATIRGSNDSSHTQILTQFLTEMDGVEELKGVVVVGATNRPDAIDPALLRPGRFDRILYIPPPDLAARVALLKLELGQRPIADDLDVDALAVETEGYSAAEVAAICNAAAFRAATDSLLAGESQRISMTMLREQIQQTPKSLTDEVIAQYRELRQRMQR